MCSASLESPVLVTGNHDTTLAHIHDILISQLLNLSRMILILCIFLLISYPGAIVSDPHVGLSLLV